jgi:hypothetical protein
MNAHIMAHLPPLSFITFPLGKRVLTCFQVSLKSAMPGSLFGPIACAFTEICEQSTQTSEPLRWRTQRASQFIPEVLFLCEEANPL